MHSNTLLPAFVALSASLVSAQRASTCTQSTITITEATQATGLACDVVSGTVLIEGDGPSSIDLSGFKQVNSIMVRNSETLQSLSSSTINAISGTWNLTELNALSALSFPALRDAGTINMQGLDRLSSVDLGDGLDSLDVLVIDDTFIGSIDAFDVPELQSARIVNNKQLVSWETRVESIEEDLIVQENGRGAMVITFASLKWISSVEIRDVKEFNIPSVVTFNDSLRINECDQMESFAAPNVTSLANLAFIDNKALTNISMPQLEEVDEFTLRDNDSLEKIDGFPELKTVSGALELRGSFNEIELPSLETVFGTAIIASTDDISDSCEPFDQLIDDGDIQGDDSVCDPNNENANEEGSEGEGDGGDDDEEDAAGMLSVNLSAAVAIAVLGSMALGAF